MATGERPRHINAGGTDDQGYPAEVPRAWLTLTELVRFAASSQLPHRVELEAEVRRDGPGLRLIMPESAAQPDSFGSIHTARWWTWLQARAPFAGLTPETATDLLLTLCGDSTYVQLTTERGWTHEQTTAWLADAAPRLLLP